MKRIQDMRSLQNIKTLRGEYRGSIPGDGRSLFLDLHVQEKEKMRLAQEMSVLRKKMLLIQNKFDKTIKNIYRLKNEVNVRQTERGISPFKVNEAVEGKRIGRKRSIRKRAE